MISILIAIGAYFYYQKLAARNGRVGWKYGFLGLALCFAVQFSFMLMYGFAGIILDPNHYVQEIDFNALSLVNILAWILSLIAAWIVYGYLERKWKGN